MKEHTEHSKETKITWRIIFSPAFLVVLLILFVSLVAHLLGFNLCPFYRILGIPCPGCGISRALISAFSGNFAQAFALHPLFWTVPLLLIFLFIYEYRHSPPKLKKLSRLVLLGLGVVFIALWLYRFATLFPHQEPFVWNEQALFYPLFRLIFSNSQ